MRGQLALVRESDAPGDLHEREIAAFAEELLRPFDATCHYVLVRRQCGGRLELPREVVDARVDGPGQRRQGQTGVEVGVDVLDIDITYEFRNRATHREWDRDCPPVRTVC